MTDLRLIAHAALQLNTPPYLRHYRRGRQKTWNGVAFRGSELPGPGFNSASCLTPTPPLAEILPVAREFFADADKGWGILVEGDAGHPVEAELRAAGWKVDEDEPAFVMPDITDGLQPDTPPPTGLAIRPVQTEADRAAFERVCTAAFNAPPDLGAIIMPSLAYATDPQMYWLLAEWGGEPVGGGGHCVVGPTAVVSCLATLESHRGRGIGAAVTRAVLADGAAKGCTNAALRSGPKSIPLYERLGFRYVCQHRTYAAPA